MRERFQLTKTIAISVAATCIALAACGDPKAASEKSFEAAIQKFMDRQAPECFIRQAKFPVKHTAYGDEDTLLRNMSALKAVGLVEIKELAVKEFPNLALGPGKTTKQRTLEVLLTDEGKKAYIEQRDDGTLGSAMGSGGFCFGKQKIVKVEQFTEPSDAMGMKVSQVNYTYRYDGIPAWAKHEALVKPFPQLAKAIASSNEPMRGRAAVILTNQGWIHERDMNRTQ